MPASIHSGPEDVRLAIWALGTKSWSTRLVDQAAVDAMRHTLDGISMDGIGVIGEGEKDEAPMLYIGEHLAIA